jgi:hypothetical protein
MSWQIAHARRDKQDGIQFWRKLSDRRRATGVVIRKRFAGRGMNRL